MKGLETKQEATSHRLFIGGLFDDVAVKDIRYATLVYIITPDNKYS